MLDQVTGFFDAYLQFRFWILHAIVGLVAAAAWVRHQREINRLKQHIEQRHSIDDGDARREIEDIESFNSYYDFCANAFILIGLLGTMYGFFTGMAKPSAETGELVRFEQVRPALATSAFGIVWAVLLNLITRLTVERRIDGLRALYRTKASNSSLHSALIAIGERYDHSISTVRELVEAVNRRLEQVFQSGTNNFADASAKLAEAARELQKSTGASATIFSAAATTFQNALDSAGKTSVRLDQVANRMVDLPNVITRELQAFSNRHAEALEEVSTRVTDRLNAAANRIADLPDVLGRELTAFAKNQSEATLAASAELAKQLNTLAAKIVKTLEPLLGLPEACANQMRIAHSEYIRAVADSLGHFKLAEAQLEQRLNTASQSLSQATEAVLKANAEQITKITGAVEILLKEVRDVPQSMRSSLQQMTQKHCEVLEAQHQANIEKTNELLSAMRISSVRELETARQKLEEKGRDLAGVYEQAYREEGERVRLQVNVLLGQIETFLQGLQKGVVAAIEGAPDAMGSRADFIRSEVQQLNAAILSCAAELKMSVGTFNEGLKLLHEDSLALGPVAASLRDAALAIATAANDGSAQEQLDVLKEIRTVFRNIETAGPQTGSRSPKVHIGATLRQWLRSALKRPD